MSGLRIPLAELDTRGSAIYASKLQAVLEPQQIGRFVAIDVESEDYEVADESHSAMTRLRARHPDAQILVERVGYPAAFVVGSTVTRS